MKISNRYFVFILVLMVAVAAFLVSSCVPDDDDDDDDNDDDNDDNDDDDDDDDDDNDNDDDNNDNDDDTTGGDPYRGQMRPCDVDGVPGREIVVMDVGNDSFGSIQSKFARLRRVDGTEIGALEIATRTESYGLGVEAQMVDLNGDEDCEIVLTAETQRWDTGQFETRLLVLDSGELTVVFDTDWRYGRHFSAITDLDVNGGGADLVVKMVDDFGGCSSLGVFDGTTGFTMLWQVEVEPKSDLNLHGKRGESGIAYQTCANPQGPSFLLERAPRFTGTPTTWDAAWIDPEGGVRANLEPIEMTGSREMSSGIMPLPDEGGCGFFVTYFDEEANHGRFRVYGPDGSIAHEGLAPAGVQWIGRGDVDLDDDGAADLIFWVDEQGESPGVWAALAAEGFGVREIAISRDAILEPVVWPISPWLYGGAEFTGKGKVFLVGPFVVREGFTRRLEWRAYDRTLSPVDMVLSIPMSYAQGFDGYGLAFWDGDRHPRIALYLMSVRVFWSDDKGLPYTTQYRWGVFGEQGASPLFLSEETTVYRFDFTMPWDFNLDGRTELGRGLQRGSLTQEIDDIDNGMVPLIQTENEEYAIIGQWY
ncbi:MAG: hypothetical protein P9L99_01900 [Candidatus Lernaella stagnicola]|nr:hypothetical protein [Candidatus Lernaella stagnicola]